MQKEIVCVFIRILKNYKTFDRKNSSLKLHKKDSKHYY